MKKNSPMILYFNFNLQFTNIQERPYKMRRSLYSPLYSPYSPNSIPVTHSELLNVINTVSESNLSLVNQRRFADEDRWLFDKEKCKLSPCSLYSRGSRGVNHDYEEGGHVKVTFRPTSTEPMIV
ncbi:hypothetical protein ABEB36_012456 [Hypothenemus hampei]|uniref:Uncharacterized protein n=1 Tax=Hypothenemus hampei TaxID=57062 RepID=A0ABD1EBF6_HYPHA